MRVLFWTEMFLPYMGGVEVLSSRLLTEFRQRGHELLVVTSQLDNRAVPEIGEYEGIPVHRLNFRRPLERRDVVEIAAVRRRVGELKRSFVADVLHLNFSGPSAYYHLATRDARICPWIVSIHRCLSTSAGSQSTLAFEVLRSADWVTAVSRGVLASIQRAVPETAPRSSIVYNGLEPPAEAIAPLPRRPPHLVCLGRLVPEKGFDLALRAFATIARRFPGVRLEIAGDGPARHALESEAEALGIAGSVDFSGLLEREQVPELMNRATVVLMPSRTDEGFGLVALEAALMARPVIAADVGGLSEVVIDGETGLTTPREDVPALARALIVLLEDHTYAQRLGRAARRRGEEMFSLTRAADEYEALYRQVVKSGTTPKPGLSAS